MPAWELSAAAPPVVWEGGGVCEGWEDLELEFQISPILGEEGVVRRGLPVCGAPPRQGGSSLLAA